MWIIIEHIFKIIYFFLFFLFFHFLCNIRFLCVILICFWRNYDDEKSIKKVYGNNKKLNSVVTRASNKNFKFNFTLFTIVNHELVCKKKKLFSECRRIVTTQLLPGEFFPLLYFIFYFPFTRYSYGYSENLI